MPFQTGEIGNPAGRQRAARNWAMVLMQDLLAAVAAGDLTPSEAGDLADVIDVYVRARSDELRGAPDQARRRG